MEEGRKRVGSTICRRRAIGRAQTSRNESEEKFLREMLTLTQSVYGSSEEREEVESSEKDKPCMTKMMTPPLACVASKGMPDREWVRSDRSAENPGKRKIN